MPVFSLEEARALQVKNISQSTFKYWSESATYGYFGGGYNPPSGPGRISVSTIARLDFLNETLSNPGKNLPSARDFFATVSNVSYGYFGGGYGSPTSVYLCQISRLDYSNETLSLPGKNLSTNTIALSACSSSSYGYFGGGVSIPPPVRLCTITRLDFSSETISAPGKNLQTSVSNFTAVSSNSYGYFGGGFTGSIVNTISKLDFPNETISLPGKNLPYSRYELKSVSSSYYGYFGGGITQAFPSLESTLISRLDFSTENTVTLPPQASVYQKTGAVGSGVYGYFAGSGIFSSIARLDFTSEITSNPGINLPPLAGTTSAATLSGGQSIYRGSKTYGYMIGGYSGPLYVCVVSRLDFSSEVISNPGKNLPVVRGNFSGATSSNYYGYFGGGYAVPGNTRICTITRLDFSNEITSDPGKNLPTVLSNCGGVSSNNYGYFGGGYRYSGPLSVPALRLCTITRLDFSTENVSNITSTLLGFGIDSMATVMNNSYGYFGGGLNVAPSTSVSNITRLDFSNETTSAPATKLPANNFELAALSSSSYGYFGGGLNPPGATATNTITRLDFSNDTLSPPGKNLPTAIRKQSTVSSNFYGYFIGGWFPVVNTVSRIDFSNETVSLPTKNNLTPISQSATFSNSN
jgi:hypothetical protein